MKPELVIVVGAGASIPCGIPGTADLTNFAFDSLPTAVVPAVGQITKDGLSLGGYGETHVDLQNVVNRALNDVFEDVNFELLLNALEELEAFAFFPGKAAATGRPVMTAFADVPCRFGPLSDRQMMHNARRAVIEAIHRQIGEKCAPPSNADERQARADQERFILACADHFRLVVIDLNYDDLFDRIPLDWEDGFKKKEPENPYAIFDPNAWETALADPERNILIHLHGSVRFGHTDEKDTSEDFHQPGKYDDPNAAALTFLGRSKSENIVDAIVVSAFPIISGRGKAAKLAYNTRPFSYYFATLAQVLIRISRLMVIGYGGADAHVQSWIREHARRHRQRTAAALVLRPGAEAGEYSPLYYLLNDLKGGDPSMFDLASSGRGQALWESGSLLFAPDGVPTAFAHEAAILAHLTKY